MLVSADFSGDRSAPDFDSQLSLWLQMMRYADVSIREVEKMRTSLDDYVSVLAPDEIEGLISSSGFSKPTLFFQAVLVHAWNSKRISDSDG
jgi:tRNA (cmo5U34)-methyltransferase